MKFYCYLAKRFEIFFVAFPLWQMVLGNYPQSVPDICINYGICRNKCAYDYSDSNNICALDKPGIIVYLTFFGCYSCIC